MFDVNTFKMKARKWIKENPGSSDQCLRDYCEELIPSQNFTTYCWLIDQTVDWFKHIKAQRDLTYFQEDDLDEVA